MSRNLVIIGAGGYAQEVLWVVDEINKTQVSWNFLGFLDPANPMRKGQTLYDRPIIGGWDDFDAPSDEVFYACGIGGPQARARECQEAEKRALTPATLIHPSVIAANHSHVGEGSVIGPRCVLGPYSSVGRHCALNIGVNVGHNSSVGDFCVLSPGAQVLGSVVLEDQVFLGANATVYLGRRMGAGSLLAANSFLLTNLRAGMSAIGVPATPFPGKTGAGICSNQEAKGKL